MRAVTLSDHRAAGGLSGIGLTQAIAAVTDEMVESFATIDGVEDIEQQLIPWATVAANRAPIVNVAKKSKIFTEFTSS